MKKLKELRKNSAPNQRPLGVNPSDPWSAKAGITEITDLLARFLSSRGINPKFVSRNTKVSHSKSAEFLKWKKDHQFESADYQGDKFSKSPTADRIRELKKGNQHYKLKGIVKHGSSQTTALTPEEVELIAFFNKNITDELNEAKKRMSGADKWRQASYDREKAHKEFMKSIAHLPDSEQTKIMMDKIKADRASVHKEEVDLEEAHKVGDMVTVNSKFFGKQKGKVTKVDDQSIHVQRNGKKYSEKYPHDAVMKEETESIDELHKDTLKKYLNKSAEVRTNKKSELKDIEKRPTILQTKVGQDRATKLKKIIAKRSSGYSRAFNKLHQEDVGDAKAATHADGMTASVDQMQAETKRQMSKSARIIKSIYKKKNMVKEDLYDWEKDDKSVKTYGKKPKIEKPDEKELKNMEKKPPAAMTLTGGTTLTGSKRDDIEIDPMMRNRPGQPDVTKKDDKKGDKDKDKKKDK